MQLEHSIASVLALDDVRPSPVVDRCFTELVNAVVAAPERTTFSPVICQRVQDVASRSETEMEIHWAQKIIASETPHETLAAFPYVDNYRELVRREINLIEMSGTLLRAGSRVLMVGTGPLPMTALELIRQRAVTVDHVDISARALRLCDLVGQRLGIGCGHIEGDGASVALETTYDVVMIAGLAGQTVAQKQRIIDNVRPSLAPGGRLVIRSARGARELLYPAVRASSFANVELVDEYHPDDDVINSVFIYK